MAPARSAAALRAAPDLRAPYGVAAQLEPAELRKINGELSFYFNAGAPALPHIGLLIAGGVLSVLFGLAVLVRPGAGALALIFVIGAFAIAYGIILVAFAFRLRRHSHAAR